MKREVVALAVDGKFKAMTSLIKPEQVLEAYKQTGLKPMQAEYLDIVDGELCGCGLSAMFIANNPDVDVKRVVAGFTEIVLMSKPMLWANAQYGGSYVCGFECGFDQGSAPDEYHDEYFKQGYADGLAAYEAVLAEGLIK